MSAITTLPAPAELTDLDFEQTYARLVELIKSAWPWLDVETRAEVARLHLEAMAHVSDHFHFYLNRLGRESRWTTATERRNILAAIKLIGYRPRSAEAATTPERFTLAAPAVAPVTFPAGTFVRTPDQANAIRFQLLADLVIAAGGQTATATVEHSETWEEQYVSDGTPYQRFRLARTPYLDDSLEVSTALGVWTEVANFLSSSAGDRHFVTTIDSTDYVTVIFGNNRTGAIPSSPITFRYKTGGGSDGRLPAGSLTEIDGVFTDANGSVVTVIVNNDSATTGGNDRESNAEIQANAPAALEVQGRAVSRMDYERIAESLSGITFALMLTRNEYVAVQENEGFLFVVPDDGSAASQSLLETVAGQFGDAVAVGSGGVYSLLPEGPTPKTTTFQLRVRGATYKVFDLYAKLYLRKGAVEATVRAAIEAAYAAYFAPLVVDGSGQQVRNPRVNFGYYLQNVDGVPTGHFPISDIANLILDVDGVRELGDGSTDLLVNGAATNPTILPHEFPAAGTVTLLIL